MADDASLFRPTIFRELGPRVGCQFRRNFTYRYVVILLILIAYLVQFQAELPPTLAAPFRVIPVRGHGFTDQQRTSSVHAQRGDPGGTPHEPWIALWMADFIAALIIWSSERGTSWHEPICRWWREAGNSVSAMPSAVSYSSGVKDSESVLRRL